MRLGFIGFGEAGFHIAKGLHAAGIEHILAHDLNAHTPVLGDKIRHRAGDSGTTLVASPAQLASECDVLLSVVTADQAEAAALQTAPFLNSTHLYADLNSVSPALKQKLASIIENRSARFVEAAIMAPVPGNGHRVPILLGGASAPALVDALAPYGMNFEIVGESLGSAAAIKMFRSVIVKGLEALLVECVLGASRYGASERIFASLDETFPGMNWSRLADYMVGRTVVHGERRAHEMDQVAATLRASGVEPIMAEATARRQRWCAELGLASAFGLAGPSTYQQVVDAINSIRPAVDSPASADR